MADTTFVDGTTVVVAEWLNDVNQAVYDAVGNGTVAPNTPAEVRANINVPTRTGGDASGNWGINVTGTAANVTGTVAIANGGTGATTAPNAFTALKQAATETATGVVELATTVEAETGTDTTRAVTAAGVEAHMLANEMGWGQTWQTLTGSRALDTLYTNSTTRPIFVVVCVTGSTVSTANLQILINGVVVMDTNVGVNPTADSGDYFFPVPAGNTYRVNLVSGGAVLRSWAELR